MIKSNTKKESVTELKNLIELLENVIDNIPVLQYCISPDGIILDCNKLVPETLGYKNKNELIGKPLLTTIYAPSSFKKAKTLFLKWKETGNIQNEELQIKTKNGKLIDVLLNVNTLYDNNGKVLSSISTQLDITKHKKTEKKLKESEEKMRALVEYSPDFITRTDLDGKILYINHTPPNLSEEEILGESLFRFVKPEYQKIYREKFKKAIKRGEVTNFVIQSNITRINKNWFNIRISPIKLEDDIIALNIVSTDITEFIKAKKEIEDLSRFPSENPNPIFRINKEGKVIYSNLMGIKQLKKLKSNVNQKAPKVFYDIITKLFKEKSTRVDTININLGDKYYEYAVNPVKNTDYANLYGRDITKQKKAQNEISNLAKFPLENPNPVFRLNNKLSVIYANKSAKKILQKTKENKILKILSVFITNIKKTKIKKLKTVEIETGDSIYGFSIIPVKDTDYFNIYGKDITEKKKSEKLLLMREKEKISVSERDYLAKELHDTVTQTLFSANLIAEVIPKLWKKNPKVALKKLEQVRQLNNSAFEEIRALLFELKSSFFENEKLGNLLKKLAKSISIRSGIPIRVQIDGKYKHSSKAELGFYRIAQEALNNVAKHSNATESSLLFESYSKHMKILISDNGNGFNSNKITPENLGLIIMKERSKLIGASLDISSNPGQGTKISITYTR